MGFRYDAKRRFRIDAPIRSEEVRTAVSDLAEAFWILGIQGWCLPNVKVQMVVNSNKVEINNVNVARIEIFAGLNRSEDERISLLKRELAKIALWSITDLSRQHPIKLLDDGWSRMIQLLGGEINDLQKEKRLLLQRLMSLNESDPDTLARVLDFDHPVSRLIDLSDEEFKAAYDVGAAFLIWIFEEFGLAKVIELLKKSPTTRRADSDCLIPSALDRRFHLNFDEYQRLMEDIRLGTASNSEIERRAREWEVKQFHQAIFEVTNFHFDVVSEQLKNWIITASM
jgi:hypothetical protein